MVQAQASCWTSDQGPRVQLPSNPPRKASLDPTERSGSQVYCETREKNIEKGWVYPQPPVEVLPKREETHSLSAAASSKCRCKIAVSERCCDLPRVTQQVSTSTRTRISVSWLPVFDLLWFVCVFPLRFTTFNSSQKLEHLVIVQTAIAISETLDRSPVSLGQSGNNNICPTDLSLLKVNWNNGSESTSKRWKRDRQKLKERQTERKKGKKEERKKVGRGMRKGETNRVGYYYQKYAYFLF